MATTTTSFSSIESLSPEQKELLRTITSQLSPELMNQFFSLLTGPEYQTGLDTIAGQAAPLDEEALRQRFGRTVADPAMQRFQEEFIPMLQERFTAGGAGGGSQERLGLRTGAERLGSELARQEESYFDTAREQQLRAASLLPDYLRAPSSAAQGYAQLGLGTQAFQPVATQTTKTSPWESFLTAAGEGVSGGVSDLISSSGKGVVDFISSLFRKKK